jgi:hypothetical protein
VRHHCLRAREEDGVHGLFKTYGLRGSFTFKSESGGTRVTFEGSGKMKGLWKLFEPMVKMDAKNSVKKELNAIKMALEPEPKAAAATRA